MGGIPSNIAFSNSLGDTSETHLSLKDIKVGGDSVSAAVCVSPLTLRIDEALAASVLTLRPTLAGHACKQGGFGFFGDTLIGSTLPHLVEHLAIDFLVETEGVALPVAGTTDWLDRSLGLMRVRVSCTIESADATCTAILRAVALVNTLLER